MKSLTFEQAELVRKHRTALIKLPDIVSKLALELSGACEHKKNSVSNCPVCELYKMLAAADSSLHDLWGIVDAHLERAEIKAGAK